MNFIYERLSDSPQTEGFPAPQKLQDQRLLKQVIIQGIKKFNEDPKKGIIFLAQQGIIEGVDHPESIARFLKGTSRADKKHLGEYISKKQNIEILRSFLGIFDFSGKRVDEALREMLETFRLPGEAQLIERIVLEFSDKYCETEANLKDVADKDAVFILSYAIIMLNTDQHTPNLKVMILLGARKKLAAMVVMVLTMSLESQPDDVRTIRPQSERCKQRQRFRSRIPPAHL